MGKKKNHRQKIELGLCRRDYNLLNTYHPELLIDIEAAVNDGVTVDEIRRWVARTVYERDVIQRCVNAAAYAEWLRGE